MSEIEFEEEEGPRYVTLEDAKGIKQYERLKIAFMEDNNVLVHLGAYGLIFGESKFVKCRSSRDLGEETS